MAEEQYTIDQQVYRRDLIDYVMSYGGKDERQAIEFLNQSRPKWIEANPPRAGVIEVDGNESEG